MNKEVFISHRDEFLIQMTSPSFALFFSGEAPHKTQDQTYIYTPNRNFYYLTGLQRENFILVLIKDQSKMNSYLFIEEPSDYATKWLGRRMTKEEASEVSGIEETKIYYTFEFSSFIHNQVLASSRGALTTKPNSLYLDLYRKDSNMKPVSLTYAELIIDHYPELKLLSANDIVNASRMFKSEEEVAEISKAIAYEKQAIEQTMKYAKAGMNEHELEAYFEFQAKIAGADGLSFDSIFASGKNGTVLHYIDNNQVIQENTLVLMDLGCLSSKVYASDITRTFPVSGKFTERQKQIYEIVLKANKETMKFVKPGISWQELNQYAKDILASECKKIGLIKELNEISKYYYHNVSHYLGLDVHDVGAYNVPLQAGMVITMEPGLYIEEEGIGIRIEDDVLVTETGYVNLSKDIIKEVKDIEDFLK